MSPRRSREELARAELVRDAEWGRLLGEALPAPEPGRGAEARVLAHVRERVWAERASSAPRGALHSRAWPWWLALASCLGAALLVSGWQLVRPARPTSAERSSVEPRAVEPVAWEAGDSDRLLTLADQVRLLLRAGGSVRLTEGAGGSECFLAAGSLLVHVPEGYGRRFRVVTGSTTVEVTGTVFGVDERAGSSSVTVWDGSVAVTRGSQRATLAAGQRWPSGSAALAISEADLERLGARTRVEPLLQPTAEGAGRGVASGVLPAVEREPAVAPSAAASSSAAPSAAASSSAAPSPAASSAGRGAEPSARAALAARTLSSIGARYREAQRLEAQGAREQAAATYAEVAESESSVAEAAAFAAARLRFGLGQYVAAQRLLEAHRGRYPEGSYARAVDVLRLRVAVARADHAAVEREALRFLQRFPDDLRAPQFRWARALSLAQSGRCGEALRERGGLSAAEAAEITAECAKRGQ